MRRFGLALLLTSGLGGTAVSQDYYPNNYTGAASFGAQESLFRYDDQEPWKHGWKKQMPYHEGFHAFRPYNYHHVFGQTQGAAAYGQTMPYSQQWAHRYHSVSAQYNHLQGQPPMAMPQYDGPPAAAPSGNPPAGAVPQGSPQFAPATSTYFAPPAPMNIDPVYQHPGIPLEQMAIPAMPAPLIPVN